MLNKSRIFPQNISGLRLPGSTGVEPSDVKANYTPKLTVIVFTAAYIYRPHEWLQLNIQEIKQVKEDVNLFPDV